MSAMPPALRLDHCVIAVSDWDRSTEFYRDVLGAQPAPFVISGSPPENGG